MNRRARDPSALGFLAPFALAAACGGPPPPATSSEGIPLTEPPPNRAAAAEPTAAAAPPVAAAPAASASAQAKPPPPAGGAPMAVIEGDTEVATTVGYRGAKIRLANGAELSLPPGALSDGLAFSLALAPARGPQAVTPSRGALGPVYKLAVRRVEGGETVGSAVTGATTSATSEGPPFVLKLPLPANAKGGANLALAAGEGGKKPAYKVYATSSVESGEPAKAVFQMPSLPGEGALHLTSAEPTEKR